MSRFESCSTASVALALLLLLSTLAVRDAHAVTFTVNSILDQPDDLTMIGTCHTAANTCTLRAAVMQANRASAAVATIVVPAGTYYLTIPAAPADGEANGDLNLTSSLGPAAAFIDIVGDGAASTIIDGSAQSRVLHVHPDRDAALSGLSIRNGYASAAGGDGGGGIWNEGALAIGYSTISDNHADDLGGGILNTGTLTILKSTISGNTAGSGAGIHGGGDVTVSDSTIGPGNTATATGGGVFAKIALTLRNSTISGNHANNGGGLYIGGNVIAINSTISHNDAKNNGGGVYVISGSANVYNTTIAFNVADADGNATGFGAGVYVSNNGVAVFNLRNTLVAGNSTSVSPFAFFDDCSGPLTGYGANLFKAILVSSGCNVAGNSGPFTDVSSLGPLRDNGGPTNTHALLPGSVAIDGGAGCVDDQSILLLTDQRGAPRIFGSPCDVGAVESLERGIDVDANHAYDPMTDGLLIIRYLFGFTGTALTDNAIGADSTIAPGSNLVYLNQIRPLLDIDGNGQMSALTDGVLLVRYLAGIRGNALIANATGPGATRTSATDIEQYIRMLLP